MPLLASSLNCKHYQMIMSFFSSPESKQYLNGTDSHVLKIVQLLECSLFSFSSQEINKNCILEIIAVVNTKFYWLSFLEEEDGKEMFVCNIYM